jgi:hypothetical protein
MCGVVEDLRCQRIQSPRTAKVVSPPGKTFSADDVAAAIQRAGAVYGWEMKPDAPGRITGTLKNRAHLVIVAIEHDAKTYSIRYQDSEGMAAKAGMIHRHYNSWVLNLDNEIQNQLRKF